MFRSLVRAKAFALGLATPKESEERKLADLLRCAAVTALEKHKQEVEIYQIVELKENESWDEYILRISNPFEFAGEAELFVLNKELGTPIKIFMDSPKGRICIQEYRGEKEPPLNLLFNTAGPPHYDPLLPKEYGPKNKTMMGRLRTAARRLFKQKKVNCW